MASIDESAEEGITADEITGQAPLAGLPLKQRNAFSALMSPKKPAVRAPNPHSRSVNPELVPISPSSIKSFAGRNGLGAYLADPASLMNLGLRPDNAPDSYGGGEVIYHTPSFVAITDAWPKATVHTLLLPRNVEKALTHPLFALQDETFLAEIREGIKDLKARVASELRRKFVDISAAEKVRRKAMEADDAHETDQELPPGRDWEEEIKVGVHAGPSMTHLHIHVLSRDMHSEFMRHRKHYNSFNTKFFVELEEFPLGDGEVEKRLEGRAGWLSQDFVCWKCGRNFGNRFKELKLHLEKEWEEWKMD